MVETGVPSKKHRLTPSHWQLSHMPLPGLEATQWWRQLAVSGNHTAITFVILIIIIIIIIIIITVTFIIVINQEVYRKELIEI